MALEVGSRLGHYQVTALIGEGGMGQVYRATDTQLGRDVALKILPDAFAADPDRLARFQREAQVLASLNHPNIAQIHGIEKSDDTQALVLELVEGPTLADRIAKGPIPLDEALPIAKQIAEGLEAAHEAGVIHRDLKPANIKVREDGTVKVLDFGLAKALDTAPEGDPSQSPTLTAAATQMGVIMGTAAYMAPEQARGKAVDPRSDIWAFGAVLFEMVTGRPAFAGETVSDTVARILTADPDWNSLPADTPAPLRRVLRRSLQKAPTRRLRHIADARLDLADLDDETAAADAPTTSTRGAVLRRVKRFVVSIPGDGVRSTERASTSAGSEAIVLALAPDGSALAYAGAGAIQVRPFEQAAARPVPGTEGGRTPCFSPDGTRLGFVDRAGDLKVVRMAAGTPETVAEGVAPIGMSWAKDDSIVFGVYQGPLQQVSSAGGEAPVVTTQAASEFFGWYWPDVLPSGRAVLFSGASGPISSENKVAVFSFDTGTVRVLADGNFPRYSPTGHIVFARGGELWAIAFNADRLQVSGAPRRVATGVAHSLFSGLTQFALAQDGSLAFVPTVAQALDSRLVWVSRDGSTVLAAPTLAAYQHPRLSADGARAAVSITDRVGVEHIWVLDLTRGARTRVTVEGTVNRWPVWAPDGEQVVFCSTRGNETMGLFDKRADGSGEAHLLLSPHEVGGEYAVPVSWSHDGGALAFYLGTLAGPRNLWFVSRDGARREVLATPFDDRSPAVSPDGQRLAYVSDESGKDEVYVVGAEERGTRMTVSSNGGTEPVWARDGGTLFYRSGDDLLATTFDSGTGQLGAPDEVLRGRADLLRTPQGNPNYDVSPDGERFLMVQRADEAGSVPLQLVLNWDLELTARLSGA